MINDNVYFELLILKSTIRELESKICNLGTYNMWNNILLLNAEYYKN